MSTEWIRSAEALQKQVESVRDEIANETNLPPDWAVLRESSARWASLLAQLVVDFYQKCDLLGRDELQENDPVLRFLFLGMVDTVKRLRITPIEGYDPLKLESIAALKARVELHTGCVILILSYLNREYSRHMPNAPMIFSQTEEQWSNQKIDLMTRLKQEFQCSSSSELSWGTKDTWRCRSNISTTAPSTSLDSSSISLLVALRTEAARSFPHSPQIPSVEELMRMSIHLLDTVHQVLRKNFSSEYSDRSIGDTKKYVALYKCAWVIHNLVNHNQLKTTHRNVKPIVELVLEGLMRTFHHYKPLSRSAITQNFELDDLSIVDPLPYERATEKAQLPPIIEPHSRNCHNTTEPSSSISSNSLSQLLPLERKDGTTKPGSQESLPALTIDKIPLGDPFDLLTASEDNATKPLKLTWNPSKVVIFKSLNPNVYFQVVIYQGHIVRELTVKPATDDIVILSGHRTVLCLRRGNDNLVHFSTAVSDIVGTSRILGLNITKLTILDLMDFSANFVGDTFKSYFPISKISFKSKKMTKNLAFSNPTAQVWTAADEEELQNPAQRVKSAQSQVTGLTSGIQRRDSIDVINQRIEASRVLFFCGPSVYTVPISDWIHLRKQSGTALTLTLTCTTRKNAPLPIHIIKGTAARPAGIPMGFQPRSSEGHHSNINCNEYTSIQISFHHQTDLDEFVESFDLGRQEWRGKATRLEKHRDWLRSPVIETESHYD